MIPEPVRSQGQRRRPRVRNGRDLERLVLARAVRWHLELR